MDTILLMKDIDQRYRAISGLSDRRHYSIFYSRIDPAPLMVLGINPGGDPTTWTADRLSSKTFYENFEHEYVDCQYAIQEPMLPFLMDLLGVGSEKIRKVPKSNLIFRRSKGTSSFKGTHGMTLTDARKESGPICGRDHPACSTTRNIVGRNYYARHPREVALLKGVWSAVGRQCLDFS